MFDLFVYITAYSVWLNSIENILGTCILPIDFF